jgi:hypothetical protein
MPRKGTSGAQREPRWKSLLAELAGSGILVPHPADVPVYLASYRRLAKSLPSVCEQARREFGQETELVLKVYRDPEIRDRYLTLYVRLPADDASILTRLDRVTESFDEALCKASGYLLVTTDLRPSRATHGI